jgi:hypothetical protein
MATKVLAATTPQVENGSRNPVASWTGPPNSPRRPNAKRRAAPPTTGGRTIGRVINALAADRPGNRVRASTQASGIPATSEMAVAAKAVVMLRRRASVTTGRPTRSPRSLHGARCRSATNGTAMYPTASAASTTISQGALP